MKLLTYEIEKKVRVGVLSKDEQWIYPLKSQGMDYKSMQEVVEGISESEKQLLEYCTGLEVYKIQGAVAFAEVKILAPIPEPKQDVICLGVNYKAHAEEASRYIKEDFKEVNTYAVYFSKRVNRASNYDEIIPQHAKLVDFLDYEVELAVVIGKDAKDIEEKDVKDYIFGYTIMNDVSARNVQTNHKQWYFGKSLDGYTPMGPCIATVGSFEYPPKLKIWSKVNGELRQDSNTNLLIHDIDHVVSELSKGITLKAGTIISTGTPSGVGMGFDPPKFLTSGDVVECGIDGIGILRNVVE